MLKKGDPRIQPGNFDTPVTFSNMVETTDSASGVVRTPQFAYNALANVSPYEGSELRSALREIGEIWSTISIRWAPSRVPIEGMQITVKTTGEIYEVRGVQHLESGRRKIELTCRLVR
jgi:head-tail adaptor